MSRKLFLFILIPLILLFYFLSVVANYGGYPVSLLYKNNKLYIFDWGIQVDGFTQRHTKQAVWILDPDSMNVLRKIPLGKGNINLGIDASNVAIDGNNFFSVPVGNAPLYRWVSADNKLEGTSLFFNSIKKTMATPEQLADEDEFNRLRLDSVYYDSSSKKEYFIFNRTIGIFEDGHIALSKPLPKNVIITSSATPFSNYTRIWKDQNNLYIYIEGTNSTDLVYYIFDVNSLDFKNEIRIKKEYYPPAVTLFHDGILFIAYNINEKGKIKVQKYDLKGNLIKDKIYKWSTLAL